MIYKVEGYDAWVCQRKNISVLKQVVGTGSFRTYLLPLFPGQLVFATKGTHDPDEIILFVRLTYKMFHELMPPHIGCGPTPNFIELVNKRWDEFCKYINKCDF